MDDPWPVADRLGHEELRHRLTAFPRWHYPIDLGALTTPAHPKLGLYHDERAARILRPLERAAGGSLADTRVLDLGCNAGFWSLRMIDAGCAEVIGVDAEEIFVDQARLVFEARGVAAPHRVVTGDVFDLSPEQLGTFDVVLCLGLMYHVSRPIELMSVMSSLCRELLVIDTQVAAADGPWFELYRNNPASDELRGVQVGNVEPFPFSLRPSADAVMRLAAWFGFPHVARLGTYQDSRRESFLFSRTVDLDWVPE